MLGPLLEVEMSKKCTPLWREANFEVKMYKTHQVRATFGGSDVEKVDAVVSTCTKHHMFAPLLEVRMLKKCAPPWREAHFQVKMYKTPHVRATFGGSDIIEGSLEVKLPTVWTDEKQSREEAERREDQKERRWRCAKR